MFLPRTFRMLSHTGRTNELYLYLKFYSYIICSVARFHHECLRINPSWPANPEPPSTGKVEWGASRKI